MTAFTCEPIGRVRLAIQEKWTNDPRLHDLCALTHRIHQIRAQKAFHSHRASTAGTLQRATRPEWSEPASKQPWIPSSSGANPSKHRLARLDNLKKSAGRRPVAGNSVANDGQLPSRQVSLLQCKLLEELHERLCIKLSFKTWRITVEYARHLDKELHDFCNRVSRNRLHSMLSSWREAVRNRRDRKRRVYMFLMGQCFVNWHSWARTKVQRREMQVMVVKRYHTTLMKAAMFHMRVWVRLEELNKLNTSLSIGWWSYKSRKWIWKAWRCHVVRIIEQRKRLSMVCPVPVPKRRENNSSDNASAPTDGTAIAMLKDLKACRDDAERRVALLLNSAGSQGAGRHGGLRWRLQVLEDFEAYKVLNLQVIPRRFKAAYDPQRYLDEDYDVVEEVEDAGISGQQQQQSSTGCSVQSSFAEPLACEDLEDVWIEECQMYRNHKLLMKAMFAVKMVMTASNLACAEASRRFCLVHLPKAVTAWRRATFEAVMQEEDLIDELKLKVSFRAWTSHLARSRKMAAIGRAIEEGRARRLMRACFMELVANAEEGNGCKQFERLCVRRILRNWLQWVEKQRQYTSILRTLQERKKLDILKLAVSIWHEQASKDALLRRVFTFAHDRWEERWREENPGVGPEKYEAEFDLLSRCLLGWQLGVIRGWEEHHINDLTLVADQYRRRALLATAFKALQNARLSFDGRYLSLGMIPFARHVFAAWRAHSRSRFRDHPNQVYARNVLRRLLYAWKHWTTDLACRASLFWVRWRIDGVVRCMFVAWRSHAKVSSQYRRQWEEREAQAERLRLMYCSRDENVLPFSEVRHDSQMESMSSESPTTHQTVIYSR